MQTVSIRCECMRVRVCKCTCARAPENGAELERILEHIREEDGRFASVGAHSVLCHRPGGRHCIALHCIALHCIALHCIAVQCSPAHSWVGELTGGIGFSRTGECATGVADDGCAALWSTAELAAPAPPRFLLLPSTEKMVHMIQQSQVQLSHTRCNCRPQRSAVFAFRWRFAAVVLGQPAKANNATVVMRLRRALRQSLAQ
jgi:hypothetical protein